MRHVNKKYEECKSQIASEMIGMNLRVHPYHWELVVRSKELGIKKDDLSVILKKEVPLDEWTIVDQIINHVYSNDNQRHTSNYAKIESYLSSKYEFRKNIVTDKVEFRKYEDIDFKDVKNYDLNSLHRELKIAHIPVHQTILPVIINSSFAKEYNPFLDYFGSLKPWDEHTDHIDQLARTVVTNNDVLWKKAFRKWIVASVGSAIKENVINHTLIVMSGKQGLGKTRWMERLIPDSLKSYYYSGIIDPRNKDSLIRLSENFLVNLDELETLNRSEIGELKQVITSGQIKIRRPYARVDETFPRRASLMGSVNTTEFLNDPTGSRRFLSFEVYKIDYEHAINMDDVYSQAKYLFETGYQYYFNFKEIEEITENNEQFQFKPLEEEYLMQYFEPCTQEKADFFLNASQVLEKLKEIVPDFFYTNGNRMNIGKILTRNGFHRVKRHKIYTYALRERTEPISPLKDELKKHAETKPPSPFERLQFELDEEDYQKRYDRLSKLVYTHFKSKLVHQDIDVSSFEEFVDGIEKSEGAPLSELEKEVVKRTQKLMYKYSANELLKVGMDNVIPFEDFYKKLEKLDNERSYSMDDYDRGILKRILKDEHMLLGDNSVIVPKKDKNDLEELF